MKVKDVITACNALLAKTFVFPVYGNGTYDGYKRPAFFTEILPRNYTRQGLNAVTMGYTYIITFLETTHDESLCLDIVDTVREAFGASVKTASGRATVEEMDFNWIDANNDVLQISIDFAPVTVITPPSWDGDIMKIVDADVILNAREKFNIYVEESEG